MVSSSFGSNVRDDLRLKARRKAAAPAAKRRVVSPKGGPAAAGGKATAAKPGSPTSPSLRPGERPPPRPASPVLRPSASASPRRRSPTPKSPRVAYRQQQQLQQQQQQLQLQHSGGPPAAPPVLRSPPRSRFTQLPPSPQRLPSQEYSDRMQSWAPALQFPFLPDMDEYYPDGSEKTMAFEQKRSEAAQQKYFEAVKRSREAVEMRRRTRDAEKQKAKEREILRELERLRELQEEQEDELRKQAWKDDMLQQRMQRELEKMHEMKEQLGACRHAEDGLDAEYETQLEELRARERDTELFITRRVTREKAKTSLMQELDNLRRDAEDKARRLQEDARAIEQAHVGSLLESKEAAKSRVALHSVMELGRTMRLAGVTRADEAHKLGIIRLPIAPP